MYSLKGVSSADIQYFSYVPRALSSQFPVSFSWYQFSRNMPTSIETKETTVSDSPTVHGCWRGKEDPQRLVSKDSQGSSEHPKVQSPDIKYRAPWPLSSSPDAKCSMQPSPTTGVSDIILVFYCCFLQVLTVVF